MDEKAVVGSVHRWLEAQGFRVIREYEFDETGRPSKRRRPDLPEAEKRVLGWLRAYPNGVRPDEVVQGLKGVVSPDIVRAAMDRLEESGEAERRGDRLLPGPVVRPGGLVVPCPIRPDVYGFRGENRLERWAVECKPTDVNIGHAIGQAYLYSKVVDRSFLAIPDDWPKLYPQEAKKEFWNVLRRTAGDLGVFLLRVGADGSVTVIP